MSSIGRHGRIYTREEGRALLGEPNCRCSLLPYIPSIQEKPTLPEPKPKPKKKPKAKKKAPTVPRMPSKAQLKNEMDDARARYTAELAKPWDEREMYGLQGKMKEAENRYAQMLNPQELREAKADILRDMLTADSKLGAPGSMRYTNFEKATEWIPYDLLNDMKYERYVFDISDSKTLRASFMSDIKMCRVAANDGYDIWAHELSHAVDDFLADNKGTGFIWRDTTRYGDADEAETLRRWFDKQHSGTTGTYKNGDGDFWRDNWINNYEGRIYTGRAVKARGQEWWAMNCQRYSKYRYQLGQGLDKRLASLADDVARYAEEIDDIENYLSGKDITSWGKKEAENKLGIAQYNLREAKADLKNFKDPEVQQMWAARTSEWAKVQKVYPDLAAFIENKFGKDFVFSW